MTAVLDGSGTLFTRFFSDVIYFDIHIQPKMGFSVNVWIAKDQVYAVTDTETDTLTIRAGAVIPKR